MELFPYIQTQFVHYWFIEKLIIFVSWFCILPPCCSSLWCLEVFLVDFFGSLKYRIILSANKDILTVSLPICIPFIFSSSLIALARNYSTMLNRSEDSGHPCLISDFRGNGFSFSPLSMILAVGLSYIAYTMLRYIPSIPSFLRAFIVKWCWILLKAFSASIKMIKCFFVFAFINVLYYIYWFAYVEPPLHPWEWSRLVCGEWSFWYVVGIQFAIILFRIFASMFIKVIGLSFSFLRCLYLALGWE
jgi:hypothetical protein